MSTYVNGGLRFEQGRWFISCRDGSTMAYARGVMASRLGRLLRTDEIVHHRNEDPTDDRPENLMVVTRAEHMRIHREQLEAAYRAGLRERLREQARRQAVFQAAVAEGYCEGRTPAEIATETGRTVSTVQSMACQLRKQGIAVPKLKTGVKPT